MTAPQMMAEPFDPYLHWLGIRDPQRPPNYYRLLGVELFESDPVVLANAADRQMAHVRTFQTGPRAAESQRILNELATAKVCLLNPAKKESYDARLRAEQQAMTAGTPAAYPAVSPVPPARSPRPSAAEVGSGARPLSTSLMICVLAAAAVVLIGLIVLYAGGDSQEGGHGTIAVNEGRGEKGEPPRQGATPPGLVPATYAERPAVQPEPATPPGPATKTDPGTKPQPAPGEAKPGVPAAAEKPPIPEPKSNPQPPPGPKEEPKTKPKPAEEPPEIVSPPPLAQSLASARATLRQRDPAAALRHLALADKVAYPKDRPEVDGLLAIAKLMDIYWKSVRAALEDLKPGQSLDLDGKRIQVVQATEEMLTLAVDGGQKEYPIAKMPVSLAEALVQQKLPQLPGSILARAAFHVIDPAGDPKRAAALLEQAKAQGLPVESLVAELSRSQPGGEKPAPAPDGRLPVPAKADQDAARKEVRQVLKDNYAAAQKPADKGVLAQTLLRQGTETRDNPTVRYVLLAEARDMALAAGDAALLRRAVGEMAKSYQVEAMEEFARVLTDATDNPMPAVVRKALARAAVDLANEAITRDAFDHAIRLAKVAHTLAGKAREGATARQAADLAASVPWYKQQYELAQQAEKALAKDPENAKAQLVLGTYWALIKNDWPRGLPLLAKGNDPTLKALGEAELAMTKANGKAAEAVKLADQWNAAAGSVDESLRSAVQRRALAWYERALPHLSGFTKTRVERVVQELKDADPGRRKP